MAIPFPEPEILPAVQKQSEPMHWTTLLSAATLITGGALIVSGHRRAGMTVAAAGTVMTLIEEQELIAKWWKTLPHYLNEAQVLLEKVEGFLDGASVGGHKLQNILRR